MHLYIFTDGRGEEKKEFFMFLLLPRLSDYAKDSLRFFTVKKNLVTFLVHVCNLWVCVYACVVIFEL